MRERQSEREGLRESERERDKKRERGMDITSTMKRGKDVQDLR